MNRFWLSLIAGVSLMVVVRPADAQLPATNKSDAKTEAARLANELHAQPRGLLVLLPPADAQSPAKNKSGAKTEAARLANERRAPKVTSIISLATDPRAFRDFKLR